MIPFLVELALLALAYRGIDFLIREDGFLRLLRRTGITGQPTAIALWLLPCLALTPVWTWVHVPQGDALRLLAGIPAAALAWQAATRDHDLVSGERLVATRLLAIAAAVASWFSPAGIIAAVFLFTTPFGLWQHHATLPMRMLQAVAAFTTFTALTALAGFSGLASPGAPRLFADASTLVFFLVVMLASHYLITALAKMFLGPRPWSWVMENRMHHLAASAYSWGWARFLPWTTWLRVIRAVKPIEKPLQASAFGVELLAPLALLHPQVAIGFCLAWAAFHLGVFALSGLLFWDWILANLAMALCILMLPDSVTAATFGPWQLLAGTVFMALFPLRHRLWKPMPLGWYDTPFTQRVHWRVVGKSGREYGLYNDFMCPHERLYGKVHGCFLAPVPVLTYHLGEAWKPELRDALRESGGDPVKLDSVRERFGILPVDGERTARHRACLHRFFHRLNTAGADACKHALPRGLRWLKAPGDQLFYWGDLPAFRGQERAARVRVFYREEFFDGEKLLRLRDEEVMAFDIEAEDPPGELREPTPKELDDFLLEHAKGRLIDLPGFGGGYVKGEDGRVKN